MEKDPARCSTGEVDNIFAPPKQQATQDASQAEPGGQASNTFSEDSQSGKSIPTRCDNCKRLVPLANHLRGSSICLQSYRGYPEFKIKGSDDEFITKVCLIIDECPAPLCHQGCHKMIPAQCLSWWKELGCKIVKWRGVNSESSSKDIKEKMSMFRRNHFRRQGGANRTTQASDTS